MNSYHFSVFGMSQLAYLGSVVLQVTSVLSVIRSYENEKISLLCICEWALKDFHFIFIEKFNLAKFLMNLTFGR